MKKMLAFMFVLVLLFAAVPAFGSDQEIVLNDDMIVVEKVEPDAGADAEPAADPSVEAKKTLENKASAEAAEMNDSEPDLKDDEFTNATDQAKSYILERISCLQDELDAYLASGDVKQQVKAKLQNAIHYQTQILHTIEQNPQIEKANAAAQEKLQKVFANKLEKSLEKSDKAMERLGDTLERIKSKSKK